LFLYELLTVILTDSYIFHHSDRQ